MFLYQRYGDFKKIASENEYCEPLYKIYVYYKLSGEIMTNFFKFLKKLIIFNYKTIGSLWTY